eukprot:GHVP01033658.1.p1 GENE.GHVP01033658.1~~GHVP01033658.1.p1  ORF type:complete len:279 (-),score=42.25 GHVP01033658.1:46-882(-)
MAVVSIPVVSLLTSNLVDKNNPKFRLFRLHSAYPFGIELCCVAGPNFDQMLLAGFVKGQYNSQESLLSHQHTEKIQKLPTFEEDLGDYKFRHEDRGHTNGDHHEDRGLSNDGRRHTNEDYHEDRRHKHEDRGHTQEDRGHSNGDCDHEDRKHKHEDRGLSNDGRCHTNEDYHEDRSHKHEDCGHTHGDRGSYSKKPHRRVGSSCCRGGTQQDNNYWRDVSVNYPSMLPFPVHAARKNCAKCQRFGPHQSKEQRICGRGLKPRNEDFNFCTKCLKIRCK